MTTPAAKWKAAERARHKEAGRVAVTVHVRPEYRGEVRSLEAKLQRREVARGTLGESAGSGTVRKAVDEGF
jgi:hypothetical protein